MGNKSSPKPAEPPALETRVRKRARRDSIRRALLSTLVIAGALPVAIAAPKVLSLLKKEHLDAFVLQDPRQRLYETAARLKRKGLIEFRIENGRKKMHLTQAGRDQIQKITARTKSITQPRKWDERWRMVMFDIPEKKKQLRNRIRLIVRNLGFYCLQDSVWVYPYDCEEVIALIKTDLRIGRDLQYVIADAIEYDVPIRDYFDLPQQR
jgi:DNA-binding PadR family transcriptional regulator